jgi:hypothetical protein
VNNSFLKTPVKRKEQGDKEYDIQVIHAAVLKAQINGILGRYDNIFVCVGTKKS